jgi:hypothetical protein
MGVPMKLILPNIHNFWALASGRAGRTYPIKYMYTMHDDGFVYRSFTRMLFYGQSLDGLKQIQEAFKE